MDRPAPALMTVTVRYRIRADEWMHTDTHDRWDRPDMDADLAACDLRFEWFRTPDESWLGVRAA